ncbi:uncharacterized protein CTRU02_215361 [Colletotrichum truncatum]|uniref:Uncharacterized protein n=1 Tax=Colletotrichum truncatum TaxID=5467 RepID=A0ACC3YCZ0_COLTU
MLDPPDDEYGKGNGWSINMAVATNITDPDDSNSVSFPSMITLQGPANPFANVNATEDDLKSYKICSFVWWTNGWSVQDLEKLHQDVDGSCNGVISADCIKDIRETSVDRVCTTVASFETPKSCHDVLRSPLPLSRDLTFKLSDKNMTQNGPSIDLFGGWGPYSNSSEDWVRDTYDQALTNVYPVLLTYKYGNGETSTNHSVFRCVRANNIVAGSRTPDTFGRFRRSSGHRARWPVCSVVVALIFSVSITSFL